MATSSQLPCPWCGGTLQRLEGRDGYRVESVWDLERRDGATVERRCIDVIYACTRCEFADIVRGSRIEGAR